jgi:cell division protein FtsB
MDKKKMKILVVVDIVILVALVIILMTLKGGYEEQAKRTANEQETAYLEKNTQVLVEQWRAIDQYSMAWKLVHSVLSGAKTEAAFNTTLAAIEADKDARFKQISHLYTGAGINENVQNGIYQKAGLAEGTILLKNEKNVKEVACGKGCVIKFEYAKGKFKNVDFSGLVQFNLANSLKIEKPAEYHFE